MVLLSEIKGLYERAYYMARTSGRVYRSALNEKRNSGIIVFLLYSLLFCVFTVGIFGVLILSHRNFMQFHDAYKQGAFRLIELQNQLHSILAGDGFNFWSWYEGAGLDEPLENFVDPCSFIGSMFPIRYIELGFTFAALLRMYLGGLAFMIMGREAGLNRKQYLTGAILYVFTACFIGLALRQSEALVNAYLFPLLVASVERIYRKKSPVPFVLTVAFYMIADIYFSYMSGIVIVIYIALRYFAYNDGFKAGEYLRSMLSFIGYGLIGMMLSAFTSAFSAFSITRASTGSSVSLSKSALFFGKHWYTTFGKMLVGTATTCDYLDIGLPVLALVLVPVAIRNISRKATNAIMTLILFVMMLIPFFCRMFNGFGYETFRWTYMLVLFATWTAVDQLDPARLRKKGSLLFAAIGLALMTAWTIGLYMTGVNSINQAGRLHVPLAIMSGIVIIVVLAFARRKDEISNRTIACILVASFIPLCAGWSYAFHLNIEDFAHNATIYNKLNESALRVGSEIEDDGFYRIDSVDAISRHTDIRFPSNENIWWKTNNLFIYNSRIPQSLVDFNVEMGNSYGYARRVFMVSNGNRMGLDFLYGVRYFLGSDAGNAVTADSDQYADYGFEPYEVIDGINVFRNKYDTCLGFVCDQAMLRSEFDKLNRAEKEQVLMEAAVIPDEYAEEIKASATADDSKRLDGVEWVTAEDVDLAVTDVPFKVTGTVNASVERDKIVVTEDGGSFTIAAEDVPDSQLMVSFDNLLRDSADGEDSKSFDMTASDGKVTKYVLNEDSRQGIDGLKNHDMSMGHCSGHEEITIVLSEAGTYTFDDFYLSAMSTAFYDECAEECMDNKLAVSSYSDRQVSGSVDTDNDGVLFLSIPAYDNWDVYVDGSKAERIDELDIGFTGVYVPAGSHEIELRYNNRFVKYGAIVSLWGLVLLLIIQMLHRRSI